MRKIKLRVKIINPELKPCPFCGNTNPTTGVQAVWLGDTQYFGWCTKCGAQGGRKTKRAAAVAAWNGRVDDDAS